MTQTRVFQQELGRATRRRAARQFRLTSPPVLWVLCRVHKALTLSWMLRKRGEPGSKKNAERHQNKLAQCLPSSGLANVSMVPKRWRKAASILAPSNSRLRKGGCQRWVCTSSNNPNNPQDKNRFRSCSPMELAHIEATPQSIFSGFILN